MTAQRIAMPEGKPEFGTVFFVYRAEMHTGSSMHTVGTITAEQHRAISLILQGEKIGCRCTYADNQTVDTECLYHRAIRAERDRLRSELTAMREDLNDARSEFRKVAAGLNDAAQCIARQSQTISRLQDIEAAASNLAKVKGRHNSEIAMNQLLEALK